MNRRIKCAVVVVSLALLAASAVIAEDYEIRLHRPAAAGDKCGISVVGHHSEKTIVTRSGQPVRRASREFSLTLEGMLTVLETDKKGQPARLSLTVAKCTRTEGETERSLLAKDTVVLGSVQNKRKVFKINGQPVDQQTYQVLSLAVSLAIVEATDDDVFGTQERKNIGDSWNINAKPALRDLAVVFPGLREEDITGQATLTKVVKVGQTQCLDIHATIAVKKLSPPVPAGFTVEKGTLDAVLAGKFPVDTSIGRLEETREMSSTIILKGKPEPGGAEVTVTAQFEERVSSRMTYPK